MSPRLLLALAAVLVLGLVATIAWALTRPAGERAIPPIRIETPPPDAGGSGEARGGSGGDVDGDGAGAGGDDGDDAGTSDDDGEGDDAGTGDDDAPTGSGGAAEPAGDDDGATIEP